MTKQGMTPKTSVVSEGDGKVFGRLMLAENQSHDRIAVILESLEGETKLLLPLTPQQAFDFGSAMCLKAMELDDSVAESVIDERARIRKKRAAASC